MTDEPAAIKAVFADWRTVKGRKQLQLIFEVPLEQQGLVLKMLGAPMPDRHIPVAIALLDPGKESSCGEEPSATKSRRQFLDLSMSQQAGIKANDLKFQLFMSTTDIGKQCEDAAEAIRQWCGVTTRADIVPGTIAGDRWVQLLNMYNADMQGYANETP